jgi:outer membrane protein assembly factor BamD
VKKNIFLSQLIHKFAVGNFYSETSEKLVHLFFKINKYSALIILFLCLISCSEYQKALKSEDNVIKLQSATAQYDKGKYNKALRLFEQIAPSYKGKPQAERLFYMYAQSLYNTNQFYLAAYQFESFVSGYPKSEKIEEAAFLGAKCFSKLSPVYSLDQVDTYKAIDKLQEFIDRFPESSNLVEANLIAKELREKLDKKSFEIAKQYNLIGDHKSAVVALENFIIDHPGTPYKEEAMFIKLDSAYQLAINSVYNKMQERLQNAKIAHSNLIKFKPDTKFKEKADEMLSTIEKELIQFTKNNN